MVNWCLFPLVHTSKLIDDAVPASPKQEGLVSRTVPVLSLSQGQAALSREWLRVEHREATFFAHSSSSHSQSAPSCHFYDYMKPNRTNLSSVV